MKSPTPDVIRLLCICAAGISCASAALEADFITTRGTITVQLEYVKAPKASANLVTLAQSTRGWVNPDGAVRRTGFYQGLPFHTVANNSSEKRAEAGIDDPGYTFQDEFDATLTHQPYVLAMSNTGPNTNGRRLTFTGNAPLPARDNRNTVFGKIPGAASRTVIDNILAAGAGATTITSITIRRTDASAVAFNELAVPLPLVQAVNGPLQVIPGTSVNLLFSQPVPSILRAGASANLVSWQPQFHGFSGIDDAPPGASRTIDNAALSSRFYQISLVRYPDLPKAGGPSGFANRKLTINGAATGTLIYQFNATGLAGTYQNILLPGEPPFFSGNFQVRTEVPAFYGPYSFRVLLHADGLGGAPFNLIRGGIDTVGTTNVTGRHQTTLMDASMATVFDDMGDLQLTRP